MLKGQDILVLLKVDQLNRGGIEWKQQDLASCLHISQSEIAKSLQRAQQADLYSLDQKAVNSRNFLEFLLHGLRYVFPPILGAPTRGLPTAWGVKNLFPEMLKSNNPPVWAFSKGDAIGPTVAPIYETVARVSLEDKDLYYKLALIDVLRLGNSREKQLAAKRLQELWK